MISDSRGIECIFDCNKLPGLLQALSQKKWKFYIPWCLKNGIHPMRNLAISKQSLEQIFNGHIWEIELQCYKCEMDYTEIKTYQDFMNSDCECLLLYYDCGNLEIYIKDPNDSKWIYEYLQSNGATRMIIKTSKSDKRITLLL